jgi:anti-sigma B factor antagonist
MNCTATVRHSGAVSIIDLAGRITHSTGAGAIREAIKAELEHDRKKILLNLNAVDFIDSSGLGEMASAFITVARLGGSLKLLNTHPRANSLLQVTGLYNVFVTFSEEQDALASFAI